MSDAVRAMNRHPQSLSGSNHTSVISTSFPFGLGQAQSYDQCVPHHGLA